MTQVELTHENNPLSLDSLELLSRFKNGNKFLELKSNELNASLNGQFNILALPEAFKVFLHKYYPSYIQQSDYLGKNQQFSFQVDTKKIDPYIKLLGLPLGGFDNSHFFGNLNLEQHQLNLNANVPYFSIGNKKFTDIKLESLGDLDSLKTSVTLGDISINDSLHFPSTQLTLQSSHDTSMVNIATRASMALNAADINARVITKNDGAAVLFFPSSFILNEKRWQILENGELSIIKDVVHANNIKLTQGNQQISVETMPSAELENVNDVLIGLEKVNVYDFLPYFFNKPRLEGILTGNVQIENPFKKPLLNYQMRVDGLRVDGDSIGLVKSSGAYHSAKKMFKFQADGDNDKLQFLADGTIYLNDSSANQTAINIQSEKFDLSILNSYMGDIFSNMDGTATTKNLKILNNNGRYTFIGAADINQGSLVVNYTQCKYKFSKQQVSFGQDVIDFGEMNVFDTLGNRGKLTGKIYHHFFDDFSFDNINFQTNRLLLLNTVKKDNNMFYGKVIGNATLKVNGTADNILMDISGEPSKMDTSQIYILGGSGIESGDIDYIDFVKYGKQLEDIESAKSGSKILLNMDLVANPSCKIDVILDEATGDVIKGVGNGKLNIRVGNKEPLSIKGRYDITKGDYTFNFQTLLKKYFTVSSGSIVWDGDPFKANIDIFAQYEADKVDFSNLSNDFRQKEDIIIVAHLTETLLKPAIDFKLKVPDGSPLKNNFEIIKRLDQFQQDKNDLNKQVTSILLFNTFINSTQGFITVSSGYNVIANTIGGVVSNALSGFFNKFLQKYVKNLDFNFDVNSSMGGTSGNNLQNTVNRLQAAAKSNLVYTLLNGRLIITAGVNLDYNNPYANLSKSNNVLVTPDITAEWILSKDGRIRIVAFNKTNLDVIGQRNRTGASLSYRKEADRVLQLFLSEEKKNKIPLKNP